MSMRFMSLGSGSSGNCYYLATGTTAVLIDAGIGIRKMKKMLKDCGIDVMSVNAVLVTSEVPRLCTQDSQGSKAGHRRHGGHTIRCAARRY